MKIVSFIFNPFQENTFLLYNDTKQCWIIDPGMYSQLECKVLDDFIEENNLVPEAIINTHGHIDHILGVNYVKDKYSIPFKVHKDDAFLVNNVTVSAKMFGLNEIPIPTIDEFIEDVNLILGDEIFEVFHVPGHSPGSLAFYSPKDKWIVAGDVLFQNSIGRTDLPGGDFEILKKSIIDHLYTLPEDTVVYSGHGPMTEIGFEKKTNPFVKG